MATSSRKKAAEASNLGLVLLQKGQDIPPVNTVLAGVSQNPAVGLQAEGRRGPQVRVRRTPRRRRRRLRAKEDAGRLPREARRSGEAGTPGDHCSRRHRRRHGGHGACQKLYNRALEVARAGEHNPRLQSRMGTVAGAGDRSAAAEKKYKEAAR